MRKLITFIFIFSSCSLPIFQPDYCDDFYQIHSENDKKIKEYDQMLNEQNAKRVLSEQYELIIEILYSLENDYADCNIKNIELVKEKAYISWVVAKQVYDMDFPKIYNDWQMITIKELQPIYINFQEKTGGVIP